MPKGSERAGPLTRCLSIRDSWLWGRKSCSVGRKCGVRPRPRVPSVAKSPQLLGLLPERQTQRRSGSRSCGNSSVLPKDRLLFLRVEHCVRSKQCAKLAQLRLCVWNQEFRGKFREREALPAVNGSLHLAHLWCQVCTKREQLVSQRSRRRGAKAPGPAIRA